MKSTWSGPNWLSTEEAEQFGRYGYYSKPFPFSSKGKIIVVNTQVCNNENYFLLSEREDPGHAIEWLE